MKVAVLRESRAGEARVALVPDVAKELTDRHGIAVAVESGAGVRAHFPDDAFREAGARVGPRQEVLEGADVLLAVGPPGSGHPEATEEPAPLPDCSVLIGLLDPLENSDLLERLAAARVTAFAMELVPRITRAQRMDALSSQATVAGYKAALLGADQLGRFLPMLMTAAGTIRPARVLVLGAGVAGLQAIATSRRLGARVEAFDVRPAVREQVESLGATFLETEHDVSAEGEGGYAGELSEEQHQRELELIANHVRDADIVITTARIPGRPAPLLVTADMVRTMKGGSVVVDLASESGGNCELSRPGDVVESDGVRVLGPLDLPSGLPVDASGMYARNVAAFLAGLVEDGELVLDFADEIVAATCVTHEGEIRHGPTRERLGLPPLADSSP